MNMKIIFFGSNDISSFLLEFLIKKNFQVLAVVTHEDKPKGRGLKISYPEVKKTALNYGLKILQPSSLYDSTFLTELKQLQADIYIVVAFKKLPTEVWSIPPYGTINVHFSLLPEYRGAAPINWVIINCEKITGITIFFINDNLDEGDIILFKEIKIPEGITAGKLKELLLPISADLLENALELIAKKNYSLIQQNELIIDKTKLKKAPKITSDICKINWNLPATKIDCLIRGLSPIPGAFCYLFNESINKKLLFKILYSKPIEGEHNYLPGKILTDSKSYFYITAKHGLVEILECQLENKKVLKVKDFLNGFRNLHEWKIL